MKRTLMKINGISEFNLRKVLATLCAFSGTYSKTKYKYVLSFS